MASLRLFYYIEKHCVKAKKNPMWKDYIRDNRKKLDSNPQAVYDLISLFSSTTEYKVTLKQKLLDLYNLGVARDGKKQVESAAHRVGLKITY